MVFGFIFGAAVIFHFLKFFGQRVVNMATSRWSETQSDCSAVSPKTTNCVPRTSDSRKLLESFYRLPAPHYVNPKHLADHGFKYSKARSASVCTGCEKVVKEWKTGDKPCTEKFHEDGCRYVKKTEECLSDQNQEVNELGNMDVDVVTRSLQDGKGLKFHSLQMKNEHNEEIQLISLPDMHVPSKASIAASDTGSVHLEEGLIERLTPLPVLPQLQSNASRTSTPLPRFSDSPAIDTATACPEPSLRFTNSNLQDFPSTSRDTAFMDVRSKRNVSSRNQNVTRNLDMKKALNRLASFKNYWSADNVFKNIHLLVICGFFCLGQGDGVQCFCCDQILANWKRNDDPRRRHLECSPYCRFARGEICGNVPLPRESKRQRANPPANLQQTRTHQDSQTNLSKSLTSVQSGDASLLHQPAVTLNTPVGELQEESMPIDLPSAYANLTQAQIERGHFLVQFPCQNPANPAMRVEHARLQTFTNPLFRVSTNLTVSNETLAQAGLYYVGVGDQTKCWYCDGGLKDYQVDDDPWVEHAKYFPECEYLLQQRGPAWVTDISIQYPDIVRPILPSRMNRVLSQVAFSLAAASPETEPASNEPCLPEGALALAMQTPLVQQARTIGFTEHLIRNVQSRRILQFGSGYQDIESFLEALLNFSNDPESLRARQQYGGPDNAIDASGRTVTIRGGNFIGPSIVGGRLIRRSRRSNHAIINGIPWEEYMVREDNLENDGDGPHVFDNSAGVVWSGNSNVDDASMRIGDTPSGSAFLSGSPEEQLQALQREYQCKICYNSHVQVLFQPCGHVCSCISCSRQLNTCPVCRRLITNRIRTFHA